MDSDHLVRICLRCGSTDIKVDFSEFTESEGPRMKCNNCGFEHDYFPRAPKNEVDQFKQVIDKIREEKKD